MELSVIIPARNEADVLAACLASLVSQREDFFSLGTDWELIVVDDGSTDDTAAIALGIAGVTVLRAPEMPEGWTGKANACWFGAGKARGAWLLFTDADTIHEHGDLRRALHEAEKNQVKLLSYSPKQIVHGLLPRMVMPLVFAELARTYPPDKVSDPASRLAAANGQFLLMESETYFAIGGHSAVAERVLEDVELARLARRRGVPMRFRYAPDALAAHMYRSTGAMMEGWTKNLALLFGNPLAIAGMRVLDSLLLWCLPLVALAMPLWIWRAALILLWLRVLWRFFRYTAKSNFPVVDQLLGIIGLPVYCWLLWNSWFRRNVVREVSWKGRSYRFKG